MSYKLYGREVFEAVVNGEKFTFTCYGQDTRYGFRHVVVLGYSDTDNPSYIKGQIFTKACYYNRTWERFRYESVLSEAIRKLDVSDEVKDTLKIVIIEKKHDEKHAETVAFISAFKDLYNGLTDEGKEVMSNSYITNEAEAKMAMLQMTMMQAA